MVISFSVNSKIGADIPPIVIVSSASNMSNLPLMETAPPFGLIASGSIEPMVIRPIPDMEISSSVERSTVEVVGSFDCSLIDEFAFLPLRLFLWGSCGDVGISVFSRNDFCFSSVRCLRGARSLCSARERG